MKSGIKWRVLPWQVEATWPKLPYLTQAALNGSNTTITEEGELSGMLGMVRCADDQVEAGSPADWQACKQFAMKGNPKWAHYADELVYFASEFAGGI